ncbi:hypothetical protein [Simplicispira metamorpha]|nr:hypothetical protein [Simplicispira metamorpha]
MMCSHVISTKLSLERVDKSARISRTIALASVSVIVMVESSS